MGSYITGQELFEVAPSVEYTVDQLERLPFALVLDFVAGTLAPYRRPDTQARKLDREAAERWLTGDALTRARNLQRDPTRRLVVPQALYMLAKLAAFHSPDAVLPGVEPGVMVGALFGAVEAIEAGYEPLAEMARHDKVVDTTVGPFGQMLMANQHLNAPCDVTHLMARFVRTWLQLPRERTGDPQVLDLEQAFGEVTGVALQDVLVVALMLWGPALNGTPRVLRDHFDVLGWDPARVEGALQLFTADLPTLRTGLMQETKQLGASWAFSTLERYPTIRLEDGSILVLDVDLLVRRIFGGLTLYDIIAVLESRGGRPAKKRASKVKGCVAHLAEIYALEVLESLTSSGPACRRVFDDAALQAVYTRKGRRIADAAVDYGDAWVVVEVTTTKLKRESVAATSSVALSDDLDKLVDEAEQIHDTIAALRADEAALTGAAAVRGRRFFPLLVVADGFPVNPVSMTQLRERLKQRGLLTASDVAPLEIVDTVELEMLEALGQEGGISLRDVLAWKEHANLFRASMRDYLLLEARYDVGRSRRLEPLMEAAWEPALTALRGR